MKIVHFTFAGADVFHIDEILCVYTLKGLRHLGLSHREVERIGRLDIVRSVRRSPTHISRLEKAMFQENSFPPALRGRNTVMQKRDQRPSVDEVRYAHSCELSKCRCEIDVECHMIENSTAWNARAPDNER